MAQDRWTVEEYRRYLETGKEPAGKANGERIRQEAARQLQVEEAWARAEREGRVMSLDLTPPAEPKRTKFGNEKCSEDGITFDSRHEHRVYLWLKARKERGELRWVFVHVPFRFTSGVVYWADFMTIRADGIVEAVWDAKSGITAKNSDYVIKKKTLRAEWGIDVCEVYAKDADGRGGYYNPDWPIMGAADEGNGF